MSIEKRPFLGLQHSRNSGQILPFRAPIRQMGQKRPVSIEKRPFFGLQHNSRKSGQILPFRAPKKGREPETRFLRHGSLAGGPWAALGKPLGGPRAPEGRPQNAKKTAQKTPKIEKTRVQESRHNQGGQRARGASLAALSPHCICLQRACTSALSPV